MSEPTQVTASIFSESVYLIEGKPFRLRGRKYLKPIYDADITEGLIKSGRQVEKSTTLSVKMANDVLLVPFCRDLYVAPRIEQVKAFSRTRLSKLFRYSQKDIIKRHYMSTQLTDQVFMKEFTNGSEVYMRHCYDEGDNIRGLSVNSLYVDEVQDILVDAIPVIAETQSHALDSGAKRKVTWYTGTPKTFSNTIEELWQTSTKGEWVIKCSRCNTYQIMGIENMEPDKFVCRKCQLPLSPEDIGNGFWKELSPGKHLKGFRISQLMVPWTDPKDIWKKYSLYSPAKFHNEVLGMSYESSDKPFNDRVLDQITDPTIDFVYRAEGKFSLEDTFIGVDWGTGEKSYTVVTVFAMNPDTKKFQMLYCKVYARSNEHDSDYQVEDIARLIQAYNTKLCVVDWGFGFSQAQKLTKMFGNRVVTVFYSHSQKDKIKWDPGTERYVVRRTDVLQDYANFVKQHGVSWPGLSAGSDMKTIRDHHLAVHTEYRSGQLGRSEEMVYTHPRAAPDDGFHACNYAYLAYRIYKGGVVQTNYMPKIEFTRIRSR